MDCDRSKRGPGVAGGGSACGECCGCGGAVSHSANDPRRRRGAKAVGENPVLRLARAGGVVARLVAAGWVLALQLGSLCGQNATILEVENIVQASPKARPTWSPAKKGQTLVVGDRVRTRQSSRATVGLTGLFSLRMDQFTTIEITPSLVGNGKPKLDLINGAAFIFSREPAREIDVRMPAANAALRGTQLYVRVLPGGLSKVQVLEGEVDLENAAGRLRLVAGEAGEAAPGQAPRRTAVIEADNLLQWALYYPAVVEPADLGATPAPAMAPALAAYRSGNLLKAVASLPPQAPASTGGRLQYAATLLAVGRVEEALGLLDGVPAAHPGKRALLRMIAAVKRQAGPEWQVQDLATASEAMAESYYLQAHGKLEGARVAALRATELAPENGYAWTRLAELEFSSARTREAQAAVTKGLALTPENARTHALRGFILSAENRLAEARAAFETAVQLDGSFGNGWLGLGLVKIKRGEIEAGRADLQTAATVEPTSSIFHSYLGKAFSREGRRLEATKDLELARLLDPNDPTPPFYSAIDKQQANRTNEAIADLERSIELNDNRRVYRSGFLLDQDRAVRGANLAKIYQNAGMREVAVREATRAVESDYTNASAHLFLANSFDALRDPDRILLRHETPWFNELLLANLLSPVGGGPLSQFVSQQEYSKLLEADGIGASMNTQWRSSSELRAAASVFGTGGNLSYGIDAYYRNDDGDRPNSEMRLHEIYGQFKWQASPDDVVYFLGKWASQDNGDLFETYDNRSLSPAFDFEEDQHPGLLLAGWNHRWAPGSNTLLLVGRLAASQYLADPRSTQGLIQRDTDGMRPDFIHTFNDMDHFTDPSLEGSVTALPDGTLVYSPELLRAIRPYIGSGNLLGAGQAAFDFRSRRQWEIYTAEIQHIQQAGGHTMLFGGRWQEGDIETDVLLDLIRPSYAGGFSTPAADQHFESDFRRLGVYAYDYWNVLPSLTLVGGLVWDSVDHPDNFRNPPVNGRQRQEREWSGKFGFTWAPVPWFTLRGAAAEGIGGLSFDESVRLEPVQLAGFNQAYRTVISESVAGSVETPRYRILGLSAEGRLPSRTWWGVSAGTIDQEVERTRGVFTGYDAGVFPVTPAYFPDGTSERLDYREETLAFTIHQLLGEQFAVGAGYRVTRSELETGLPELRPLPGTLLADEATLHEWTLHGTWNSPSGFFAHLETNWFRQDLHEDPARGAWRPGDDFVQVNAWVGYRFHRNLCEISAGVLNLGGGDYHLSPLSPHPELARDRTFFVNCRMSF